MSEKDGERSAQRNEALCAPPLQPRQDGVAAAVARRTMDTPDSERPASTSLSRSSMRRSGADTDVKRGP